MIKNIYMIAAITDKSYAIGYDKDMIYHIKNDLKYFKYKTINNTIICGRKTYFTFPKRPLPNRKNIILTRSNEKFEGANTFNSKEEVIKYAKNNPDEDIFIVGGDSIYKQFLDVSSKLYLTEIKEKDEIKADSYFPEFDKNEWVKISESEYFESNNSPEYKFVVYERK